METLKIGICEPDHFSKSAIEQLESIGSVSLFNGSDVKSFIKDKDVLFIRLKYLIDDDLISNSRNLKYICSPTTGLNHVKISNSDISIISLKGEYSFLSTIRATPEHVFGLTLSLLRNYSQAFLNQRNPVFDRNPYRGYELYHNSIGIIGLGRVGRIIAKYFSSFESDVYYYDVENRETNFAQKCYSTDELIEKSNVIILCANYTVQNENMINNSHFEKMKGKYFVNAARGELVNESDLLSCIEKDWFKGVAIDVISNETSKSVFLDEILKYTSKRNLIVTPHIGGATFSSMNRTEEFIAEKLIKIVKEM